RRDRGADHAIRIASRDERSLGDFVGEVDLAAPFLAQVDRIIGVDGVEVETKSVNAALNLALVVQNGLEFDDPEIVLLPDERNFRRGFDVGVAALPGLVTA